MIPGLTIPRLVIGSALLVGGGAVAVLLLRSDLPPATPLEEPADLVHERACTTIAHALPPPLPGDGGRLLLPPVAGDRSEALRTRLARAIDRTGRYEVVLADTPAPEGWFEAEVLPRLAEWLAGIPGIGGGEERPTRLLEARIDRRRDDRHAPSIEVDWRLRDLAAEGRTVAAGVVARGIDASLWDIDFLRSRVGAIPAPARFALWLAILAVPALAARRILVEVLHRESNAGNAALWVAVALPGAVAGYVLTAFAAGWGGALLAIAAVCASLLFAYAHLNRLELGRRA